MLWGIYVTIIEWMDLSEYCCRYCYCSTSPLSVDRRHYQTLAFPTTTSHSHSPCITISSCIVVSVTTDTPNNSSPSFINI
mmetsp:Transcript_18367/g.20583  ORF Transcript_18367/g.20583 Transcript_18367/m.20583 type:complete len:80 (+) Transcript_18367:78-317(+)